MNGFELYQQLKNIDDKVKVCFITAYEIYYRALRDLFPTIEVDCFIAKPIKEGAGKQDKIRTEELIYDDVKNIKIIVMAVIVGLGVSSICICTSIHNWNLRLVLHHCQRLLISVIYLLFSTIMIMIPPPPTSTTSIPGTPFPFSSCTNTAILHCLTILK